MIRPEKAFEFSNLAQNDVQFWRIPFFFFFLWRSVVFGLKKHLNYRFWPKNPLQFRRIPFFFVEISCFWAEKAFELSILAEKSASISAKTFFFFFGDHLFLG